MAGEVESLSKVKGMLLALIDSFDEDELITLLEIAKLIANKDLSEDEEMLLSIDVDKEKVLWQLAVWKDQKKQEK